MLTEDIHKAWHDWIARDEWEYFGTATFKEEVTKNTAEKRFARLLTQVRDGLGTGFRCIYVTEGGNASKRAHVHFLIGGISYRPEVRRRLQRIWNAMGGMSHIVRFDKAKREAGIHYILKTVRTGESDQVNFFRHDEAKGCQPAKVATGYLTSSAANHNSQTEPPVRLQKTNGGCSMNTVSSKTSAADVPDGNNAATLTLPSITIKRGHGYHVERQHDHLILVLPLTAPRPSSTGKTNVIGSTGGPRATFAEFDGWPILLNAVAMVKPSGVAWKQRIYAVLARWEGKLC